MSNNIDLKSLWGQQQPAPKPDISGVINKAKRVKKGIRKRLLWTNICLIATAIFIADIGISEDFALVTTRIGVVLIIIAIVMYIVVTNGSLKSVYKTHPEADNTTYLAELLAIRKKQEYLQGTLLKLYFILLSAGLAIYMTEFLLRMTVLWASVYGLLTFGWIAFSWFYLSPRTIRKQQRSLNEAIAKLEAINEQVNDVDASID